MRHVVLERRVLLVLAYLCVIIGSLCCPLVKPRPSGVTCIRIVNRAFVALVLRTAHEACARHVLTIVSAITTDVDESEQEKGDGMSHHNHEA